MRLYKVASGEPDWIYGTPAPADERFCGRRPAAALRPRALKLMNGINAYRHRYLYASGDFPRAAVQRFAAAVSLRSRRFMAGTPLKAINLFATTADLRDNTRAQTCRVHGLRNDRRRGATADTGPRLRRRRRGLCDGLTSSRTATSVVGF